MLMFDVIAILKGRTLLGICGLFVPLPALFATCRVARPGSPWARRWYRPGSRRPAKARRRFPPGRRNRWEPLVDVAAPADLDVRALVLDADQWARLRAVCRVPCAVCRSVWQPPGGRGTRGSPGWSTGRGGCRPPGSRLVARPGVEPGAPEI
ncbi:hypothetical protein [Saccharothrix deserti]|uniref:hypothetical protein n=1 Tax=Saccharothrix deserti TaxID=2593674 RepID=UPI00131E1885|nr:hypothetical protein [Saccharothrix deserti]